jgi:hypothetical protein
MDLSFVSKIRKRNDADIVLPLLTSQFSSRHPKTIKLSTKLQIKNQIESNSYHYFFDKKILHRRVRFFCGSNPVSSFAA